MHTRLLDSKINNDPKHITTTISIGGMTCAACVARVEKTLMAIEGVFTVSVNYGTEQAEVEYNTKAVNFRHLQSAIIDAGYGLVEWLLLCRWHLCSYLTNCPTDGSYYFLR